MRSFQKVYKPTFLSENSFNFNSYLGIIFPLHSIIESSFLALLVYLEGADCLVILITVLLLFITIKLFLLNPFVLPHHLGLARTTYIIFNERSVDTLHDLDNHE